MTRRDNDSSEGEFVAIAHFFVFKSVTRTSLVADIDFCRFKSAAKLTRTTNEIGVNMGLENMGDRDVFCARQLEINFDIGPRIEHCRDALFVVSDQIRNFRQPFRLDRKSTRLNSSHSQIPYA